MSRVYKFSGSKAMVEEEGDGFVANCRCGWSSGVKPSRELAVIEFENHVQSDPKHMIREEERKGVSFSSLFLAVLCGLFIVYSFNILTGSLAIIGWIGNFLMFVLGIVFVFEGLKGRGPVEIISGIFK